ncbi:hypothetical protein EJ02DRAFT_487689 [Clathrospora elynae]|uniref:Uncharacterized protein n=1 Tax=Clathrospora elynae TaxID=706981 RepID=A0A6A5SWL7_9PLEO|nr:hypothetical protein EJ02DRAFT_487689 [Clathrospora elynae]
MVSKDPMVAGVHPRVSHRLEHKLRHVYISVVVAITQPYINDRHAYAVAVQRSLIMLFGASQPNPRPKQRATSTAATAADGDDVAMSDAPVNDDSDSEDDDDSMLMEALQPVRADDSERNPIWKAITDADVRRSTQCLITYNKRGRNAKTAAAVSKQFILYASKTYLSVVGNRTLYIMPNPVKTDSAVDKMVRYIIKARLKLQEVHPQLQQKQRQGAKARTYVTKELKLRAENFSALLGPEDAAPAVPAIQPVPQPQFAKKSRNIALQHAPDQPA